MSQSARVLFAVVFTSVCTALWISLHTEGSTDGVVKTAVRFAYDFVRPARVDPPVVDVSKVTREISQWQERPVSVLGVARSFDRSGPSLRFRLEQSGTGVDVSYTGIVPSTLVENAKVVVIGVVTGDELAATGVMVGM